VSGLAGVVHVQGGGAPPETRQNVDRMANTAAHRATRGTQMIEFREGAFAIQHDGLTSARPGGHRSAPLPRYRIASDLWLHDRPSLIGDLGLPGDTSAHSLLSAGYEKWGADIPDRLIGEFAIVLWDPESRQLLAARDALGMRPLCYSIVDGCFVFASEISQLLQHPSIVPRLREDMIARYLVGDMGGPEDSFYEGIRHVPAGHTLIWDGYAAPVLRRYWGIDTLSPIEQSDSDYVEHFLTVFREVVEARAFTPLKTGISLSGGVDSGSVAAVAGRSPVSSGHGAMRAYSYAFDEYPTCDERTVSDSLARELSMPVVHVPGDDAWPTSDFPQHPPDIDEPLIGPFRALNRRLATAAAADGVEVVLTGVRGDTMMGLGIAEYLDDLVRGRWGRLWRQLQTHSAATGTSVQRLLEVYVWRELRGLIWPPTRAPSVRASLSRLLRRSDPVPPWVSGEFARRTDLTSLIDSDQPDISGFGFARRERISAVLSASDVRETGWVDRLYSHSGIRFTDPWSDRRIAEFAVTVPQRVLNSPGADKRLAHEAMAGLLPDAIHRQLSKGSLKPLFDAGLRSLGRPTIESLFTESVGSEMGFVDEGALRDRYEVYAARGHGDFRLWWAITLEMWLRAHWAR